MNIYDVMGLIFLATAVNAVLVVAGARYVGYLFGQGLRAALKSDKLNLAWSSFEHRGVMY